VILVDVMLKGMTINSNACISMLKKFRKRIKCVWSHKNLAEMLLQHDNARPHTSLKTREAITKLGWTLLTHPPYSPDLAPSDFHLFRVLKNAVSIVKFKTDDEISAVRNWLYEQGKEWY
jgi:histone-lysine N-methyltransferase SETMAR